MSSLQVSFKVKRKKKNKKYHSPNLFYNIKISENSSKNVWLYRNPGSGVSQPC